MTRQNTILGIVAIVLVVIVGAFVFWPEAADEATEPVATTEGGGTASAGGTAPTADETVTGESGSETGGDTTTTEDGGY